MPAKQTTKSRKSTKANKKTSVWKKFLQENRAIVLLFVIGFALVGSYLLIQSNAQSDNRVVPFVNVPERGLNWAGLKANEHSALCGGKLLEMIDSTGNAIGCTHGPDPAPEGVDPRQPVEALSTGEELGTYALTGSVACDGDGTTGNRVQLIYAHASDQPDNYDTYAASFQAWAANIDREFNASAAETGGSRQVRWVTDINCNATVARVTLSSTGDDSFSNTAGEVRAQGYNRSDRKYVIWTDATMYCGIAQMYSDDSAASTNRNNVGPQYARVDKGCWGLTRSSEAHELMHTLGGVQDSAPHSTLGGHCYDEYDRMCYNDRTTSDPLGPLTITYPCGSATHDDLFDCNHDDYYSTNPASGSYLATHWNAANSSFLINGGSSAPTPPPPPTGDVTVPSVTITSPKDGATVTRNVTLSATASDNIGVTKMEIYIDGYLKASSTTGSISSKWNTGKASKGAHIITVKAYDAAGNVGTATVTVYK